MKTKPMAHQSEGLNRMAAEPLGLARPLDRFALGAEQGTGKTWMLLADAERAYADGRIDGMLVIAPRGVHVNWVRREIPAHVSTPVLAEFWLSGCGKRHRERIERLFRLDGDKLAVLAINVDALITKDGFALAMRFVRELRCMIVVDESQKIKNPASMRSKRAYELRDYAVMRRIASGTLVDDKPLDLFGQYEFLAPGLLGTRSYRAFVAEYAQTLPSHHPLVQEAARRAGGRVPQIIARDEAGRPIYRNLSKLSALMRPHTFRVLKSDCLDLPPKIYQTHYFELNASQRRLYDAVAAQRRFVREDGTIDIYVPMTTLTKLRQITSGFILAGDDVVRLSDECQPRLAALRELIEDCEGKVIVWASFVEEIKQVQAALEPFGRVVTYFGETSSSDREAAIDDFQNGDARFFVANPAAGGTGLTLTAASTVIYYSCDTRLGQRQQSEDRAHRIGTTKPVVYVDIVARDTIDEVMAAQFQAKESVAAEIMDAL